MVINIKNFFNSANNNSKLGDFQDLAHLDGVSISTTSANLYNNHRDDVVMFYFREGANFASVYTQSKIISENIKWNQNLKNKKIYSLLVNTRNANAFTGKKGYQAIKDIADDLAIYLSEKQKQDEEKPQKIKANQIILSIMANNTTVPKIKIIDAHIKETENP